MRFGWIALALGSALSFAWAFGCNEDDAADNSAAGCGDANGVPSRLMLTVNNTASSELVAFNLETRTVDGRMTFDGFIGTVSPFKASPSDPYLLEQATDLVARLDAKEPWRAVATWSTKGLDEAPKGAAKYSDPSAIVVPSCGKGYIPRFTRNALYVIDTTDKDSGASQKAIDMSKLLHDEDKDGIVEMTTGVYVPSKGLVFILLGNVDITKVAADGFTGLCANTNPTLIGIDPKTDTVVSLGGTGAGGGIELEGYGPPLGVPLVYDKVHERVIVVEGGCNVDNGGAAGAVTRRRIEAVDLVTKSVSTLASLDKQGFPTSFLYIDDSHAALTFAGSATAPGGTFLWNPQETSLGSEITGGIDYLATDGKGNIVGPRTVRTDGGASTIEIVSVSVDGGKITTLGSNPFTDNTGFLSGADVWPKR